MKDFSRSAAVKFGLVLCLLYYPLFVAAAGAAEPPPASPPASRNPKAVQILESAVAQLGGLESLRSIQSWTATAAESWPIKGASSTVHLEIAAGEMREVSTANGQTGIFTTGHGHPAIQSATGTQTLHRHVIRALFIPLLAAKYLQEQIDDVNYSIDYLGQDGGGTESMVRTVSHASAMDQVVTPQVWYIDNATKLPVKVTHRLPDAQNPNKYATATVIFSGYQSANGVLVPLSSQEMIGNRVIRTTQFSDVQPNAPVSSSDFAPLQVENQ